MQQIHPTTQAIEDYDRLETSFTRAMKPKMHPQTRIWWLQYYDRRCQEIAAIHHISVDKLITDWLNWRNNRNTIKEWLLDRQENGDDGTGFYD